LRALARRPGIVRPWTKAHAPTTFASPHGKHGVRRAHRLSPSEKSVGTARKDAPLPTLQEQESRQRE